MDYIQYYTFRGSKESVSFAQKFLQDAFEESSNSYSGELIFEELKTLDDGQVELRASVKCFFPYSSLFDKFEEIELPLNLLAICDWFGLSEDINVDYQWNRRWCSTEDEACMDYSFNHACDHEIFEMACRMLDEDNHEGLFMEILDAMESRMGGDIFFWETERALVDLLGEALLGMENRDVGFDLKPANVISHYLNILDEVEEFLIANDLPGIEERRAYNAAKVWLEKAELTLSCVNPAGLQQQQVRV